MTIEDGRIVMIGPIRQEILSGISKEAQFEYVKEHLSPFEDTPLTDREYRFFLNGPGKTPALKP